MRRLLPLAAAAFTAAATAVPSTAVAATNGSVSGNLSAKPPKGAQASVVATSLVDGSMVSATRVSAKGAFKVSLPAGAYALSTTVVPKPGGGAVSTNVFPFSLKKGQKRTKIKVTPKKLKAKKKASAKASRSYTQELGQVTPGVTAFGIEEFTGGSGDWAHMARGLSHLLVSDLVGKTAGKTAVVATGRDRQAVESELELQKKYRKYFDPKTTVKRNFIVPDLTVGGTVSSSANGETAEVTVTIRDSRTGDVVDTITQTLTEDQAFEGAEQLAKTVGERVCRRPAAYELRLTVNGQGTFGTHTTSGTLDSTLTALRSGGAPGEPASAWSGVQGGDWTGVTGTSKVDCSLAVGMTAISWTAQLAVVSDTEVKVTWSYGGLGGALLTATCPVKDAPPVVIPGLPGPALMGITPDAATLPLGGGTIPLSGGTTSGDGGWSNTGQIAVKPVWTK